MQKYLVLHSLHKPVGLGYYAGFGFHSKLLDTPEQAALELYKAKADYAKDGWETKSSEILTLDLETGKLSIYSETQDAK